MMFANIKDYSASQKKVVKTVLQIVKFYVKQLTGLARIFCLTQYRPYRQHLLHLTGGPADWLLKHVDGFRSLKKLTLFQLFHCRAVTFCLHPPLVPTTAAQSDDLR